MRVSAQVMLAVVALGVGACTVHQTTAPPLSGPSELALAIGITATPDSISQDGASQSSIAVIAHDANGRPINGLPIRLDMAVNGAVQDFGTLSTKSIVTGSDGRAVTVYTAPAAPPPGAGGSGTRVSIIATPTGSNYQTAQPQTVDIRLVPTGVILPPAGTPTASFTVTPTPVSVGTAAIFDASASSVGSGASAITSYSWSFGDGSTGTGKTASHTFSTAATYNVTLTVTNDRSLSASTSQPVAVGAVSGPTPQFVYSPGSPSVGQTVIFNADQSVAAPGHTITTYNWNFGDGGTSTGFTASHAFASAGTYSVVLAVADDIGQKGTTSKNVTVAAASGGGSAPTSSFTISPSSPGVNQSVFFNASASTPGTGTISSYAWDFGDGTAGTGMTPTHAYTRAGTYTIVLTVTNSAGGTATTSSTLTISAASSQIVADFVFSPTNPAAAATVYFDATPSTPTAGATIATYAWDFGDGNTVAANASKFTSHAFGSASTTYVVRLTVTDTTGASATTTKTVATK